MEDPKTTPLYLEIPFLLNQKIRKKARTEARTIKQTVIRLIEKGLQETENGERKR